MNDKILETIKKMLGFEPDYDAFDADIKAHINMAFMVLAQLGVGPVYAIESGNESWADYVGFSDKYQALKTYVYLKTKLVFDPPSTSFTIDAMQRMVAELEWRLNVLADPASTEVPSVTRTSC